LVIALLPRLLVLFARTAVIGQTISASGKALQFSIGLHKLAHDLKDFSGFTKLDPANPEKSCKSCPNEENE